MSEQGNYCVYCHTNKYDGKRYIGITKQEPKKRWNGGAGYATQYFGKIIKKQGWDSFEHVVLFAEMSYEQAIAKESELIKQYNTTDSDYGYNRLYEDIPLYSLNEYKVKYEQETRMRNHWQDELRRTTEQLNEANCMVQYWKEKYYKHRGLLHKIFGKD